MFIPPQGFRHAVDLLLKNALRKLPVDADRLAKDLVALGDDMKASPDCTEWVIAEFERIAARPAPEILQTFGRHRRHDIESRDVFLIYVPEDRLTIAAPLAVELTKRGVSVGFSEYEVASRDELLAAIERGLSTHRVGVLLCTETFELKAWAFEATMAGSRLVILRDTSNAILGAERLKRLINDIEASNLS